jgi:hypothetical protein
LAPFLVSFLVSVVDFVDFSFPIGEWYDGLLLSGLD